MSFLDSPICRCELMHAMVLTDQTQRQCAEEHECPTAQRCPLGKCFAKPSDAANALADVLHPKS
ncbi:MAG: hypothetical protein ACM3SV_11435 [Betaproteobacteria bacterium]